MIELLRARQMSRRTEEAYLMWCRQFVEFHAGRPISRDQCTGAATDSLVSRSISCAFFRPWALE